MAYYGPGAVPGFFVGSDRNPAPLIETMQSAATYLAGERPANGISRPAFEYWRDSQLLLPVADVIERRWGGFTQLLPPGAAHEFAALRHAAVAADAGERQVLTEVLSALADAGMRALLLKGVALAYTVYPAPWLRARSDIDLLVAPGTLRDVAAVLTPIGFQPEREVTHPLITRQRHFTRRGQFRVAVDVHDALANPPVLRTLPHFEELLVRAQSIEAIAPNAWALGTPDALLHAAVHRVAHHNSSIDLLWLYDMHLLAAQMDAADWRVFADRSAHSRVAGIAADGLRILVDVLDSAVPPEVIDGLGAVRGEPSAALLGGELTEWRLQWINFKSLRGIGERLQFIRAHLAPPASDVSFGARPSWQLPFGYLSRVLSGARRWLAPISRSR